MNASTIVGYITQPNGNPISGAEIWICEAAEASGTQKSASARTDSRGYFQLPLVSGEADISEVFGGTGNLKVSVGKRKDIRQNAKNNFQVSGYLINEVLEPEA